MSALEMYDKLIAVDPEADTQDTKAITSGMAAFDFGSATKNTILHDLNEKGKHRSPDRPTYVHPDLEDLNFGPLGHSSTNLPPPIRPSTLVSDDSRAFDRDGPDRRGSLSDFSDYESSDENTHRANAGPSYKRNYVTVSDDDPFADPFADDAAK